MKTHPVPHEQTLIASVQRALRLVEIIANSSRPMAVKALARASGLSLGTTYNLVRTLVHEGYLAHEPDGLVLGTKFPTLDQTDGEGVFLARVRSTLRDVTTEIGATAYLSRYADGEVHLVDIVDARDSPRVELWVGLQASAHATALGKQILAGLTEPELLDYLSRHELEELTPHTISDRRMLLHQLERTRGASVDREEYAVGFTCVAVPVLAPGVVASLAVSMPVGAAAADHTSTAQSLREFAGRLSIQLGAEGLA